ncbi:anaerobic benzoate catabolism transcriptional regulator [Anatilimnocola aggregata]|uniref:Anaerobic benzoate catabolism transcriptional regulator n=2 Tax=Anatilimnocola aggregata TaxID=2528021 RepID=A0A517Y7P4_9BACT|nr:anaerobic benzoate catabolism transcriptional regulator [Anatilimnocola aggregata]
MMLLRGVDQDRTNQTVGENVRPQFLPDQLRVPSRAIQFRQLGLRVWALRAKKGLSQEGLGLDVDLHPTFVSMVERGERNVTIATVEKLAKALKCRMADLMPDADE